ncbi:hypothetical protein ACIQAC_30370 [Streptomyces sp. NPDC088387]|uniref:hypothetical protein n=1 Tax=Streptomyces sp. NPDC088387 TaxID=3365859 RepID=UPI0037F7C399
MIEHTAHGTLTEEIARAVRDVPGVAFLRPGLAGRLRSALAGPDPDGTAGASAAVRLIRPADAGPWLVEIHLVALRRARTVDVARAARRTVEDCLAATGPAEAGQAQVTVTVTGLV